MYEQIKGACPGQTLHGEYGKMCEIDNAAGAMTRSRV